MKTTTALARRAIKNWPRNECADRKTTNHNRRGWMRSVAILGPKWLAARKWSRDDQKRVEEVAA
jgi:hypothetical protein